MRLFVAIPIPQQATDELAAAVERMRRRPGAEELRWSPPESWHVTLQFLGNVEARAYVVLTQSLRAVRMAPVRIAPEQVGAFERVGILYAGVRATPELLHLERRVADATAACGFARENRPYQPHITLARRRGRGGRDGVTEVAQKNREAVTFTEFTAGEFALYESFLGAGAKYEVRERFHLR